MWGFVWFTYLLVFESLDSVGLTLDSLSFHGVGPLSDSALGGFLEGLAVGISLVLVSVFVRVGNLTLYSVQLVQGDHCCALLLLAGSVALWSSDSTRVGRGWWLQTISLISTSRHFCFCNY